MADVLLQVLSNTDIDWMIATGQQEQVTAGTVLLTPCAETDSVYLILDGALSLMVPQSAAQPSLPQLPIPAVRERELLRLPPGEIVGEAPLLNSRFTASIRAAENSIMLAIPRQQLIAKLQQDIHFSAHFYKAVALILSERLRQMLSGAGQSESISDQPLKETAYTFGELRDSDVDWLLSVGRLRKVEPGTVLLQAGRPVDALYIVLDGLLQAAVPQIDANPLAICFECTKKLASTEKTVANLSRGELVGAIYFLDFRPTAMTVRCLKETLLLSIAQPELVNKLQQDMSFASRFYRVLALQLSSQLQVALGSLGCTQQAYCREQGLQDVEYDDEMNIEDLEQVSQGAMRFNWVLKRLGIM
ncbi:MAG: cyclic nucleotide-binding domain-containing protein [Cyanobacteria bacterium RM1_2_2]|nr:cyclic nucleotide-binding domain-containing protein [Cyanobacteria bacterium RM1_2_2]